MYHKKIETQQDALDYLRKGEPDKILDRLEELSIIVNGHSTELINEDVE